MLDYIIKVLLFQTLFLVMYDIVLKKETFFQWNRAYLILTSLVAYVLPILKFKKAREIIPQESFILPEVMVSPSSVVEQNVEQSSMLFSSLALIFWIGFTIATILFVIKLYRLIQLIANSEKENKQNYWLVFISQPTAFSFFKHIFLDKTLSEVTKKQIIEHELIHVQQKHSLDLLFFELQRMVFWFNPYSYIYQKRISELHEFIADAKAIKLKDKTTYFKSLLAQTFGVSHISFINPFFKQSLIKKRILMLNKNKSKQILKLKYVLLIPILVGMLIYTSCERKDLEIQKDTSVKELIVELDAKVEEGMLTDDDMLSLIELINKTNNNGTLSTKKQELRKRLLEFILLNKRMKTLESATKKKEFMESEEIPFTYIDQAPIFPGCEDTEDIKKCLQDKIREHVNQNFDVSIANGLGLESGKKRVFVMFTIDSNGKISNIRARGPHKITEQEAVRVIKKLPQMKPGKHNGKKVAVKYTLPIALKVQ